MRRKREKKRGNANGRTPEAPTFAHQPFRALERRRRISPPATAAVAPAPVSPAPPPGVDEAELFRRAMHGVTPLPPEQRAVRPAPVRTPEAPPRVDEGAEALAELCDLVAGNTPFDIAHSTEFVEGCAAGVDPRLLRRLRRGEFAYQSHLDLHGMTSEQARDAVDAFLRRAVRLGQRCVLIVHGRGLNSKDQVPVLKRRLTTWLGRGSWSRMVLAFTSARQCDGGLGALYVLLRRRRHDKKDVRVTEGARW